MLADRLHSIGRADDLILAPTLTFGFKAAANSSSSRPVTQLQHLPSLIPRQGPDRRAMRARIRSRLRSPRDPSLAWMSGSV
jgi:hypothetical protein